MTPLSALFAKYLPDWAVWPAVTGTYVLGILLLLFFGNIGPQELIYIDMDIGK